MADNLLIAIDEALASRSGNKVVVPWRPRVKALPEADVLPSPVRGGRVRAAALAPRTLWDRVPWLELFLATQFLWGVLLFIPGAQPYRGYIRALPYVASLALLVLYLLRAAPGSRPRGSGWLIGALLLLVMNLLHPTTPLTAGIAQCVFQLAIAAPMFWVFKRIRTPQALERLLVIVFVMNFVSAALGILQVYSPERFNPPQFSTLGLKLNDAYVSALTYVGNNGRTIVRPPGLTDQPGGAAVAGGLTALLGLGLLLRARKGWHAVGLLCAIGIGLAVIYLTQVRAVLLTVIGAGALLGGLTLRRGRMARGSWILGVGATLIVASFWWASSLGGDAVDRRFLQIRETGALQTYQENRGHFLSATVGELLSEFPLGAGVGRWGMMNVYFGNPAEFRSAPVYVEIQLTGWLIDGGVPMWLLYGGAVLLTVFAGFRLTAARDPSLAEMALTVLAIHVFIVGFAMASPPFNTQLGILFWTLAAGLHGAASQPTPAVDAGESLE
jgi:hypothetical protein